MTYFDSLKFATWTALECQTMDFSPEIAELKRTFEHVEKQVEFFLSTLQHVYERDVSLRKSWTDGKISDMPSGYYSDTKIGKHVSIEPILWKMSKDPKLKLIPSCIANILDMHVQFDQRLGQPTPRETRLQTALRLFSTKFKDANMKAVEYNGLDTSGRQPTIPFSKYQSEMEYNNNFIEKLYEDLNNRSEWELWSWKMPEIEKFRFDLLRLNRTVRKETLARKRTGIFTRKLIG